MAAAVLEEALAASAAEWEEDSEAAVQAAVGKNEINL
jgi:hypothetical protein